MNINWKLRMNPATIAGIATGVAGLIFMIASQYGYQLPFAENDLVAFITTGITIVAFIINQISVLQDPTTKGISDSAQAMLYDSPRDDTVGDFTQADIQKFLNTTEEKITGEIADSTHFIRMKGHTIYWGSQMSNAANKGDYFIDKSNHDLIYQHDGQQWIQSNLYAIVNDK